MRKTYQLTFVLSICFAFVSLMGSCNFRNRNPIPANIIPSKESNVVSNKALMNQITAELFEPELEEAAKKICKQDFLINKNIKKFSLECQRYGSVSLQKKENNTGKYGTCKFRISFTKNKKRDKYRGYVDITLTGLIEIHSDGSLQFVPTKYKYDKIDESIWQWKKSEIKEGVEYVLNWAPTIIETFKP